MIYNKRGTWYLKEEGKDIQMFATEEEAKEAATENPTKPVIDFKIPKPTFKKEEE